MRHSAIASASPTSSGTPPSPGSHATSANLSSAFEAKSAHRSAQPSLMKLTTNRRACRSASSVLLVRSTHTSSIGGSAETEQTAFVVRPFGSPSASSVVTIATPVGNALMIPKNSCRSTAMGRSYARRGRRYTFPRFGPR